MKQIRTILAMCLCVCLCLSLATPAFAANSLGVTYSATLDNSTLYVSDADQTLVMTVTASQGVTLEAIEATVTAASPLTIASIESGDRRFSLDGSVNTTSGLISWDGDDSLTQFDNVTDLIKVTFTVPANTAAGTYEVGISGLEMSSEYGTKWETGASATATLTIEENPAETDAYTATINADKETVKAGEAVTVSVNVDGTTGSFASSQVVLTYDPTYLTFDPANTANVLNDAEVETADGTITIVDHGETQNEGVAYQLVFSAVKVTDTTTPVALQSAGFSTAADAEANNLTYVDTVNTLNITIENANLTVTLADGLSSDDGETVAYGGTYTFYANDANYDYEISVNDGTITPAYDEATGVWTIENVTKDLTIAISEKTPKSYTVTWEGTGKDDIATKPEKATYKSNFTVTLPADKEAGTEAGYSYSISATRGTGDAAVSIGSYDSTTRVLTINGDDITDVITITVNKETIDATQVKVELDGATNDIAIEGVEGTSTIVDKGEDVTLVLDPDAGYEYTVEIGDAEVPLTDWTENDDGTYTYVIEDIATGIKVTVTKELDLSEANVKVSSYLALDAKTIYLVQVTTKLDDGNVYTYNGENMYWSNEYNEGNGAYAVLVILDNEDADGNTQILDVNTAIPQINIATGSVQATIDYSGNVNMADASTVDANDAQLVYNMYQTKSYTAFTDAVTMQKFLRADVNADGEVDVEDATAIVNTILAN